MSDLIVIENTGIEVIEVAPKMEITPEFNTYLGQVNSSAASAASSASIATTQADRAEDEANRAASFVGAAQNIPHSHVVGPVAVNPDFQRLSDAYDDFGKRYKYGQRIWGDNGTSIWEGTTNLLPAGSENFITGWANNDGCVVTDYPIYITGIGNVIAKRITSVNGSTADKLVAIMNNRTSGGIATCSLWAMKLSGNARIKAQYVMPVSIPSTMTRISTNNTGNVSGTTLYFSLQTDNAADVLDIVVFQPQAENKTYATAYTDPGTTRAAESMSIPVNAYQKNLLTANQATGGDTLGDTTGFTAVAGATVTRDTTEKWNGTGSIKVVTPGVATGEGVTLGAQALTVGKIYTVSFYGKGNTAEIRVNMNGIVNGSAIALTGSMVRYSLTFPATASSSELRIRTDTTAQAATFYVDGLQLEESTTASDWALPVVDYSNAVLNPSAGTIELTLPAFAQKGDVNYIFEMSNDSGVVNLFRLRFETTSIVATVYDAAGVAKNWSATVGLYNAVSVNVKIRWSNSTVSGIYINGSALTLVTSGAGTGVIAAMPSYLRIGCNKAVNASLYQINSSVSNLRISRIARTDTEMAYTGQLLPDEYTTYYSDLKESISSRPYVKVNGQAQNVVLAGDSYNQNAIINGDFRLASRGASFTDPASGTYTLDGWIFNYNGTGGTKTVSQQSFIAGQQDVPGAEYYMRLTQTAPTGQSAEYLWTRIENANWMSGRKVRLALYARSPEQIILPSVVVQQNFGSGGSTSQNAVTITNLKTYSKMNKYSFEFTMPSVAGKTIGAGNHIYVLFGLPLNSAFTFDLADVELKPADAPDVFYRRDLQIEQQLMSRYLQKIPAKTRIRHSVMVSTDKIYFEFPLPAPFRGNPALASAIVEGTNWQVRSGTNTAQTGFAFALFDITSDRITIEATKAGHGLSDANLYFVTNVLLSAELI